ncbi:MAG: GSU2403 family nucleotidyltransferase fold protein [Pseudomonadota bacterium]
MEQDLALQTLYAELVDRLTAEDEEQSVRRDDPLSSFEISGSFVQQQIDGRTYWYFQPPQRNGHRPNRVYVGPADDEHALLKQKFDVRKEAYQSRRRLVSALKAAGVAAPDAQTARVVDALSEAGMFRYACTLIGTTAFQCYGGMLGVKLRGQITKTGDIDLAASSPVGVAVGDSTGKPTHSLLDLLAKLDPAFREIPALGRRRPSRFSMGNGLRIEVLVPHVGGEANAPTVVHGLGTGAQPLRFLDYLLEDTLRSVVLTYAGCMVRVPLPERFAVHKLIVARERDRSGDGQIKANKDLRQAETLFDVLYEQRPLELEAALQDAWGRGPGWRKRLAEANALLKQPIPTPGPWDMDG